MSEKAVSEEYLRAYQQWQLVVMQKDQLLLQLNEVENALNELKKTNEEYVYKLVGNLMVKKKKEDVMKDLEEKKELLTLKIKSLEKQEKSLREKLSEFSSATKSKGAS